MISSSFSVCSETNVFSPRVKRKMLSKTNVNSSTKLNDLTDVKLPYGLKHVYQTRTPSSASVSEDSTKRMVTFDPVSPLNFDHNSG